MSENGTRALRTVALVVTLIIGVIGLTVGIIGAAARGELAVVTARQDRLELRIFAQLDQLTTLNREILQRLARLEGRE